MSPEMTVAFIVSGGMERRIHSGIYRRAVPKSEAETSPEKQGKIRKV